MIVRTINDRIRYEKLHYDNNRQASKISVLSSGKLHKYEYITGEDILPSNQQQQNKLSLLILLQEKLLKNK